MKSKITVTEDLFTQIKTQYSKNKAAIRFIAVFAILFLLYKLLFAAIWRSDFLFQQYYDFSIFWINGLLLGSEQLLHVLGYEVGIIESLRIVKIAGTSGVTVGEPCVGFDLMALSIGLIFSMSNKLATKLKLSFIAVLIINVLNILRISTLAVLVQFDPFLWEINHKFVFTIIVYAVIFAYWHFVIQKTRKPA